MEGIKFFMPTQAWIYTRVHRNTHRKTHTRARRPTDVVVISSKALRRGFKRLQSLNPRRFSWMSSENEVTFITGDATMALFLWGSTSSLQNTSKILWLMRFIREPHIREWVYIGPCYVHRVILNITPLHVSICLFVEPQCLLIFCIIISLRHVIYHYKAFYHH